MLHRDEELLQALAVEDVGAPGPRREAVLQRLVADGAHLAFNVEPPLSWPSNFTT
jgi:hypothetical protein